MRNWLQICEVGMTPAIPKVEASTDFAEGPFGLSEEGKGFQNNHELNGS
jgi:hypothetical protein